jgi:DNA adenine methylase
MGIKTKPFVKWAGGKTYLFHKLLPLIEQSSLEDYCEPMIGGGALFWAVRDKFKKCTVGDINHDLMNLYLVIRDYPDELIAELKLPKYHYTHKSDPASLKTYMDIRASSPTTLLLQAARVMFLNRTCFNGLMRTNKSGKFNVPPGSYRNPEICNEELILADSKALHGVTIKESDVLAIITSLKKPSLLFIDPPYYGKGKFTGYSGEFTKENQKELVDAIVQSNHQFIYTNRADPYIVSLFANAPDVKLEQGDLRHSVQPKYTTGKKEKELIASRIKGK